MKDEIQYIESKIKKIKHQISMFESGIDEFGLELEEELTEAKHEFKILESILAELRKINKKKINY